MKLIKMSQDEFDVIKGKMIADYAKDKIKMGIWGEEDALDLAKETFETILKKGIKTENNFLYNVIADNGEEMAFLWIGKSKNEIFVYNISMYESFKALENKKELLNLIEETAVELKATKISYHTFGYQKSVIEVFENSGYRVTDVTLSKKI